MTADIPIVVSFVFLFITSNTYGWGLLHDTRFIVGCIAGVLLYMVTALCKPTISLRIRLVLLVTFIFFAVFGSTISAMQLRNKTSSFGFISDSALQMEIAGRYLLLGYNPYSKEYTNTDLASWEYKDALGSTDNPALYHLVYPPFLVVISASLYRIFSQYAGWFDIRIVYLLAYASLLFLAFIKFRHHQGKIFFLTFVCLQPLFISTVLAGYTDVVVLALFLWSVFFLGRKRLGVSAILFGLSLATKQTAWFAIPIVAIYLWQRERKKVVRYLSIAGLTWLIFFVPFIWWDAKALMTSLILSPAGVTPHPIPVSGYGLGSLLIALGKIPDIYSSYPFWFWQLGLGIPVIAILLHQKKSWWSEKNLLLSYTIFLSVLWFSSRYFTYTHIGFLAALTGAAWSWDGGEDRKTIRQEDNI